MKLVDANVLLAAVNADAPRHEDAYGWLVGALSGGAPVGFAWNALLAFVRISTLSTVFPRPLSTEDAMDQIDRWLQSPSATVLAPGVRHPELLRACLEAAGRAGNLANDAHLAAIALEHRATVVTFDRDFARFPGLRWEWPA
jgi:uncharacterized protein